MKTREKENKLFILDKKKKKKIVIRTQRLESIEHSILLKFPQSVWHDVKLCVHTNIV